MVSTPQRFDWNSEWCGMDSWPHFNPATVRLEFLVKKLPEGAIVFQPRNGSIGMSKIVSLDKAIVGFNPATVRLESLGIVETDPTVAVSTPQRFDWNHHVWVAGLGTF